MNEEQKKRANDVWQKYSVECEHLLNASKEYTQEELDQQRREVIPEVVSILKDYLSGKLIVDVFKTQINSV